jgi:hypothetical protein
VISQLNKDYFCRLCGATRKPNEFRSHLDSAHNIKLQFLEVNPAFIQAMYLLGTDKEVNK